jgi:hypothetical protein
MTRPQRALIHAGIRKLNYDTQTVTLQHTALDAERRWVGKPVDAWLDTIDQENASLLIRKIQRMTED